MLSAMMLDSFWQRIQGQHPDLPPDEVEHEMYRVLHRMEAAQNRLGRKWLQLERHRIRRTA